MNITGPNPLLRIRAVFYFVGNAAVTMIRKCKNNGLSFSYEEKLAAKPTDEVDIGRPSWNGSKINGHLTPHPPLTRSPFPSRGRLNLMPQPPLVGSAPSALRNLRTSAAVTIIRKCKNKGLSFSYEEKLAAKPTDEVGNGRTGWFGSKINGRLTPHPPLARSPFPSRGRLSFAQSHLHCHAERSEASPQSVNRQSKFNCGDSSLRSERQNFRFYCCTLQPAAGVFHPTYGKNG